VHEEHKSVEAATFDLEADDLSRDVGLQEKEDVGPKSKSIFDPLNRNDTNNKPDGGNFLSEIFGGMTERYRWCKPSQQAPINWPLLTVANGDNDSETFSCSKGTPGIKISAETQPSELEVTKASSSASGSVKKQEVKSSMKSKVADGKKRTIVAREFEKEDVGNSSLSLTVDVHSSEVGKDKSVKTSTAPSPQTPLQKISTKMANISRCKMLTQMSFI
jgi:hypothetical protein